MSKSHVAICALRVWFKSHAFQELLRVVVRVADGWVADGGVSNAGWGDAPPHDGVLDNGAPDRVESDDGPSDVDYGILLCGRHHDRVHHHNHSVLIAGNGA